MIFQEDDILTEDLYLAKKGGKRVCGLNLTCAWPLPTSMKESYDQFRRRLGNLNEKGSFYIYPYEQTHITIATLIDFKKPNHTEKEIMGLVADIDSMVEILISGKEGQRLKPFLIEFKQGVLTQKAGYLQFDNSGGEIFELRSKLKNYVKTKLNHKQINADLICPDIIHSTILRFKKDYVGGQDLVEKFKSIAAKARFGKALIEKLLLTYEKRPYMIEGTDELSSYALNE